MLLELQEQELRLMVGELEFLSWPPVRKRLALELHSVCDQHVQGCYSNPGSPYQAAESLELPPSLLQLWGEYPPLCHR